MKVTAVFPVALERYPGSKSIPLVYFTQYFEFATVTKQSNGSKLHENLWLSSEFLCQETICTYCMARWSS